jgi:hypothetical protein
MYQLSPDPPVLGGNYIGTVLLFNETHKSNFDLYYDEWSVYAFDNVTHEFKAIYDTTEHIPITNWNPNPPPPSIFTPPSQCYPISDDETDHSKPNADGISFPTSFSMIISDGNLNYSVYYNADDQMWRADGSLFSNTTTVQLGNKAYNFLTAFSTDANPPINPLPCVMNTQSFGFPGQYFFPPSFPNYLGQADYNGSTADIYEDPSGIISYWINGSPIFFFSIGNYPVFLLVKYYKPGPPPENVFKVPDLCIP